ncbi:O-antigen ligase family protein, partial [Motilibacter deserti]
AGAVVVVAALAVVVPRTDLYARLTGDPAFDGNAASGTVDARRQAWDAVLDWTDEKPGRVVTGAGFGPDFLARSGAAAQLEGTTYDDVRAPHDYPINTYARMGLVGLAALAWVLAAAAWRGGRSLRRHPGIEALLPALVATVLFVPALVGVILESPFGAVPFFWAVGALLLPCRAADEEAERTPPSAAA